MVNRQREIRRARNAERVRFPSLSPFLLRDLARHRKTVTQTEIPASLHLPPPKKACGKGVIVLQGLGGPKEHRETAYGALLAEHGYVALVPNSFAGRDIRSGSDTIRALFLTEAMMVADAFSALRFLALRPDVASNGISVVGFSYGGMISVLAAYRQIADLVLPNGPRFAGHVSYYGCSIPRMEDPRTMGRPVLMLMSARDRNVCPRRTIQIAGDLRRGGSQVHVETFDAHHQWDGNDERKRHVLFNLRACRMRVGGDNEVYDERTGVRMGGPVSRTLLIAFSADPRGYTIQQDFQTQQRSDRLLLSFLARLQR